MSEIEIESASGTGTPVPGLIAFCSSPRNLRRALRTSLIVGPILTLINQTAVVGAILTLRPVPAAALFRLALTFAVPFLVSLLSSAAQTGHGIRPPDVCKN